MKSYSLEARLFLLGVCFCGVLAAFGTLLLPNSNPSFASPILYAITLALAFLAGSRKVSIVRSARFSEHCCISLGFFITIFCLLAFGPRACVWAALLSATGACALPRRLPWHQFAFNVASITVTAWVTAVTYVLLKSGPAAWMHLPLLQTMAAVCVYFLMNSGFLAIMISLTSQSRRALEVWSSLLWTAPSYFAGASLAMLVQLWAGANLNLLLMLPVLAFLQQSYQTYVDKLEESRRHLQQRERDVEELKESRQMLEDLYTSTVNCLATAIDAKDEGTHAHIQRVQKIAVGIALGMQVEGTELEAVRTGALLHDVGKLGVPDQILLKRGPLTDDEFRQMKQHTIIGAEILKPVHFPWPVIAVVRHHHERWDGRGYPDALAGLAIPLSARIMTVADVYDALTSDRPYRPAWTQERTIEYIQEATNSQFDPDVVDALLRFLAHDGRTLDGAEPASVEEGESRAAIRSIARNTSKAGILYDIAQLLNVKLSLEERCERICQRMASTLAGTDCAVMVSLSAAAGTPTEETGYRLLATAGARGAVFCRNAFLGPDGLVERSSAGPPSSTVTFDTGDSTAQPCSFLTVPLGYAEETVGVLCWFHPDPEVLTEDDRYLLLAIAEQVQRDLYHYVQFERAQNAALTDPLTGLHNIRYLASPLIARRQESEVPWMAPPVSVLYLDLDDFKPINDTFGRACGDRVLTEVAHLLQRELRPADEIVRYGGDEFVAILPQTSIADANRAARRLRDAVRAYDNNLTSPTGEAIRMDVSIGVAESGVDGGELHTLISTADVRMYLEKVGHKSTIPESHALVNAERLLDSTSASRRGGQPNERGRN